MRESKKWDIIWNMGQISGTVINNTINKVQILFM